MYGGPHDTHHRSGTARPSVLLAEGRAVPHYVWGGLAMGRGRAKAKQTKVARELKYYSPDTDLRALERELHGNSDNQQRSVRDDRTWDEDDDDDAWGSRER